ncbi:hypothetical protein ACN261_27675 [Micromonospora sp. WMMD723]
MSAAFPRPPARRPPGALGPPAVDRRRPAADCGGPAVGGPAGY